MVITDVTPEERTRMREKLKPVVEKHLKTIGEALVQELTAELKKVRARN
jgi:TRAP-type transport system periplasmic protein